MLTHNIINYPRYVYNVFVRFIGEIVLSDSLRTKMFRLLRKSYRETNTNETYIQAVKYESEYPPFSVAISVYEKDNAEWFDRALESIIINQTVKPSEVVLVVDGPVPKSIQAVIDKYSIICNGR